MKACPICLSTFEDNVRFCPFHGVALKVLSGRSYQPGESINGYYLKKRIGVDGLGELFCATKGNNTYRFRIFSDALLCDSSRASRLLDVLEKNSQINGGGVPVVDYDFFDDGSLYSAQPYIPGRSFRDILGLDCQLSEDDVADLLYQLLRAVKDVHGQRVVHGNLSLSNIILDNAGRVRLQDAGYWDILRGEHFADLRDDHPEVFEDIVDLMSPEVARGEEPKTHSDVYSCGAAATCLLVGHVPSGTAADRMVRHVNADIQDVRSSSSAIRVSDDFADLLIASMLGTSGVRFQTPRAFITALLSTHDEIDENAETLSSSLTDRLLTGAERPDSLNNVPVVTSATKPVETVLEEIRKAESDVEVTRRGTDPERTVVEKTSWDDLADLVGDSLDSTALTDMLDRAVTSEMDSFETAPTQELPAPLFASDSATKDVLSDILGSLSVVTEGSLESSKSSQGDESATRTLSHPDDLGDRTSLSGESHDVSDVTIPGVAAIFSTGLKGSKSSSGNKLDELALSLLDSDMFGTSGSSSSDRAVESAAEVVSESSEKASEEREAVVEVSEAVESEGSVSEVTDMGEKSEAAEKSEAVEEKSETAEKSEAVEEKSETAEKSEATEEVKPEASADAQADGAKPHKRIGRKKDKGDEAGGSEVRRVKRRRRRDPKDCEPTAEVILSDVKVLPATDKSALPAYSKLPGMTSTGGFVIDDCDSSHDEGRRSSEEGVFWHQAHDDKDDAGWFGDEVEPAKHKRSKKTALAIAVIIILALLCIGVGLYKNGFFAKEESAPVQTVNTKLIEQFYAELDKKTADSYQAAKSLLDQLVHANTDKQTLSKCRRAFIDTLQGQAKSIQVKNSDDLTDPLDISRLKADIDIAYSICTAGVDSALPNAAELTQNCVQTRDQSLTAVRTKATNDALALKPEIEKQLSSWSEIVALHEMTDQIRRTTPVEGLTVALMVAQREQSAYQARLSAIEALAQIAVAEVPASPEVPPVVADAEGTAVAGVVPENVAAVQAPVAGMANADPSKVMAQGGDMAAPTYVPPKPMMVPTTAEPEAPMVVSPKPVVMPENTYAEAIEQEVKKPKEPERPEILWLDDMPVPSQAMANTAKPTPTTIQDDPGMLIPERTNAQNSYKVAEPSTSNSGRTKSRTPAQPQADSDDSYAHVVPANTKVKRINLDDEEDDDTVAVAPMPSAGPVSVSKLIADAQVAMSKKQFAQAVNLLEQAKKQEPKNYRVWFSLAKANEAQKKFALAASQAEESCKISNTAGCYVYLGELREKAGMNNAVDAYKKALALDPNNAKARSKVK